MAYIKRLHVIGVVPDCAPNADAVDVSIPEEINLQGTWGEVAQRCRPFIPKEHHMVRVGPARGSLTITSGGTEDAPVRRGNQAGYVPT